MPPVVFRKWQTFPCLIDGFASENFVCDPHQNISVFRAVICQPRLDMQLLRVVARNTVVSKKPTIQSIP